MFNEKRIDEIRKKIQISTILSDHEKSDWLNLLELMNDKQLGELEEILGVMPTASQTTSHQGVAPGIVQPPTTPTTSIRMPPLSHIANIPTDVTMTHSVPQPLQQRSQPESLSQSPKVIKKQMPMSTPPVNPETDQPTPHQPTPHQPIPHQPIPHQPAPHQPTRVAQPSKPSSPAQTSSAQLKKLTIGDFSEIQAFDVSTLRQFELQSIVDAMRSAIEVNGYFQILQQFEASPLYRSYIETGKFMLGHGTAKVADPETTLTQMELEFITDLLRHMRFNTW